MNEIGKQYAKDPQMDPSGFRALARLHQSKFRAYILGLACEGYGNCLQRKDAELGKNFYYGLGIFQAVKKYKDYDSALYANMLRSEHIPFNFFVPLEQDKNFCAKILNEFFGQQIRTIDKLLIEYAPSPSKDYLNDQTSFDTYIEYTHADYTKGLIGIEVKYTERAYILRPRSKEAREIENLSSIYYSLTARCNLYTPEATSVLRTDNFRQIWRNQLLGESVLQKDKTEFKHAALLILFPNGNSHFRTVSKEYADLLTRNESKFLALTYEEFLAAGQKHCPNDEYQKWLDYLTARYIVQGESKSKTNTSQ